MLARLLPNLTGRELPERAEGSGSVAPPPPSHDGLCLHVRHECRPLHGIPMLVKNNIGTADDMNTTAGSWILYGAKVPRDAGVVTKLRASGVVILGKTNMCQWAGYRCKKPSSGWSAHGGQTFAPYYESQEPCGSSGGSAVAVDLGLAFAALGTETDGSVVWPAQRSGVVGIKPTVGMTSRDMVVPISERMDTVGTIAHTVRDAAYALQAITGPDPHDGYTTLIPTIPDFVAACKEDALRGSRIGVPWNVIEAQNEDKRWDVEIGGFKQALEVLEKNGATVIEVEFSAKMDELREAEYTVMGADFMSSLALYFAELSVNPSGVRTLAELRDLTQRHPKEGFPGKNTAHWDDVLAQGWDNSDARFAPACERLLELGGPQGLLGALDRHDLTAVAMPTTLAAEWTAVVGAPMVSVPMGHYPADAEVVWLDNDDDDDEAEDGGGSGGGGGGGSSRSRSMVDTAPGVPYGLSFLGRLCSDADLVGLAYAFERQTRVRERPVRRWAMADVEVRCSR
ncbi:Amidase [Purpureocillium takamizusanense]|uniref:Amidase n=1 Tax=Purpureocillium takamizusanense TaxID=2060973 RepID=A0A9Q8V9E2_9HYPO|nr:Amidase [Purpureocillium takamizusanense]UNI18155.1 Amidase [Purpureocillium takamizusanense]